MSPDLKGWGAFAGESPELARIGRELLYQGADHASAFLATGGRQGTQAFEALFLCGLESVLYTQWENWGTETAWPQYRKWRSAS